MKRKGVEDFMCRMFLTYNEKKLRLDEKHTGAELKYFSFPHGLYEVKEKK